MRKRRNYKKVWNLTFKKYDYKELPWISNNIDDNMKQIISSINIHKGNALEIGCGTGNLSEFLSSIFKQVEAIDISEKMISICNEKNKKVTFFEIDFFEFETIKEYDFILSHLLFHHISKRDISDFFMKINSLLKHDGVLLMTCFLSPEVKQIKRNSYFIPHNVILSTVSDIYKYTKKYFEMEHFKKTILEHSTEKYKIGIFILKKN